MTVGKGGLGRLALAGWAGWAAGKVGCHVKTSKERVAWRRCQLALS